MREDVDDFDEDDEPVGKPRIPVLAKAAGIIWILYGVLGLFTTILGFVLQTGNQAANGGNAPGNNPGSPCCSIIITIAFAYCGLQTLKGEAKDTLGNSIGSLILGLLQFGLGVVFALIAFDVILVGMFVQEMALILSGFLLFMGSSLLTAGTLGLLGRSAYLDWRAIAHPKKKKKRRKPEPDEEDDED